MRFYNQRHKLYCGIDLHARKMYVRIIDADGKTKLHQNLDSDPALLFDAIFPFLEDVVIGVECMFAWYWIADFCSEHKIPFVLGHVLYMKAIHGGKTKNDKIDSYEIAKLFMGGNMPKHIPISQNESNTGSFAAANLPGTPAWVAAGSHPKHQHTVQSALF